MTVTENARKAGIYRRWRGACALWLLVVGSGSLAVPGRLARAPLAAGNGPEEGASGDNYQGADKKAAGTRLISMLYTVNNLGYTDTCG